MLERPPSGVVAGDPPEDRHDGLSRAPEQLFRPLKALPLQARVERFRGGIVRAGPHRAAGADHAQLLGRLARSPSRRIGRVQLVVATPGCCSERNCSSKTSAGVRPESAAAALQRVGDQLRAHVGGRWTSPPAHQPLRAQVQHRC